MRTLFAGKRQGHGYLAPQCGKYSPPRLALMGQFPCLANEGEATGDLRPATSEMGRACICRRGFFNPEDLLEQIILGLANRSRPAGQSRLVIRMHVAEGADGSQPEARNIK